MRQHPLEHRHRPVAQLRAPPLIVLVAGRGGGRVRCRAERGVGTVRLAPRTALGIRRRNWFLGSQAFDLMMRYADVDDRSGDGEGV
jgi:hypothetical protein